MGDFRVKAIDNNQQRMSFYKDIITDLKAFKIMLEEGLIEKRSDSIGAEQELCLIDECGNPSPKALAILKDINNEYFTNELALFNAEINLHPQKLKNKCFKNTEEELIQLLIRGRRKARNHQADFFLTGILPTLKYRDLQFDNMTPEPRYRILSNELLNLRGREFEIYLQGVDDFHTSLKTVLFEACNTSFQLHLQINPDEFVEQYNWSQMIAGPILATGVNSPLLFGKELWAENRIALFKQSLDTRGNMNYASHRMPRVYFGTDWLRTSPLDLWKKELIRFPLIISGEGKEDSLAALESGIMPKLRSIRLHNGTTYTWNRMCYGVHQNNAHIRIECRYLPSGPTVIDEMANFALWVGVMKGQPEKYYQFWKKLDFKEAKSNFIKAARTGMDSVFDWHGRKISAQRLILEELLPMAEEGLKNLHVDGEDINKYLGVIRKRVEKNTNGSDWTIRNYRKLKERYRSSNACQLLTLTMKDYQKENTPVHEFDDYTGKQYCMPTLIEDLMKRDVLTVQYDMSAFFAAKIMEWKNIHHLPVENKVGNLIGIISASQMEKHDLKGMLVEDLMVSDLITCDPSDSIKSVKDLMKMKKINSILITENNCLVGIVTNKDLEYFENI